MSAMAAEPPLSPLNPVRILESLPPSQHADFLALYREAVAGAAVPEGFAALLRMLRLWSMRAAVVGEPWYAEALEQANGPLEGGMFLNDLLRSR